MLFMPGAHLLQLSDNEKMLSDMDWVVMLIDYIEFLHKMRKPNQL